MEDIDFPPNDTDLAPNGGKKTGLRLILPPLSAVKGLKGKKKGTKGVAFQEAATPKVPRPVKLKPLREVLTKLISQIKRKDDYAFFLAPVDTSLVPGYSDVIHNPMDFGTIAAKVQKGRYRSLEEFTNDVRLVTTNAKTFNPPGTIYHNEAERIELFAIDHINKAVASVIEYETDWNIDVERDEDPQTPVDGEDTPMDIDGSTRGRSPSVASTQTPVPKRGAKPKKEAGMLSESLEPDGHLPGYKDGVGQFPQNSEWAPVMLALKLKGKRYRTKKERLRVEKSGPPIHADGSIDYTEMEDPFSVLSVLLPESSTKPQLTSLYSSSDPYFPSPTALPPTPPLHTVGGNVPRSKGKRRHWTIARNAPARRARDTAVDGEEELPAWKVPREAHATDYGVFATLAGHVAREYRVQNPRTDLATEAQLFGVLRHSIDRAVAWRHPSSAQDALDLTPDGYWARRGRAAEEYVQDVVYGGVDGLAYVRSLAEFVSGPTDTGGATSSGHSALGMPLSQYIAETVIDPLTDGRHRLLRETSLRLAGLDVPISPSTSAQVDRSLNLLPQSARHLVELREIYTHSLDMTALIHASDELFKADEEWAGRAYIDEQQRKREEEQQRAEAEEASANAMQYLAFAIKSHEQAQAAGAAAQETRGVLQHALEVSADLIVQLANTRTEEKMVVDGEGVAGEDPLMRKLRLNLLSLAKRAPLDKISRLPSDLVPKAIRHIVPTIEPTP